MILPPQQLRCLAYLSYGMTYKEIGIAMGLSPRTVEYYVRLIKKKRNEEKRSALTQWFLEAFFKAEKINNRKTLNIFETQFKEEKPCNNFN